MLGFAVVLAITAVSMGFAYLGFEGVSTGVAAYRNSVAEADLARNIDRELISYRGLARYYVVTGKEDDGKAALQAEAEPETSHRPGDEAHQGSGRGSTGSGTSPGNSIILPRPLPTSSRSRARTRSLCRTS